MLILEFESTDGNLELVDATAVPEEALAVLGARDAQDHGGFQVLVGAEIDLVAVTISVGRSEDANGGGSGGVPFLETPISEAAQFPIVHHVEISAGILSQGSVLQDFSAPRLRDHRGGSSVVES